MLNKIGLRLALIGKQSQQTIGLKIVPKNRTNLIQKRFSGGHHYGYREINYESSRRWINPWMNVSAGMLWWWILWNTWHEWQHLVGHYVWPDQSSWSDQHLGIPPDDED